MVSPYYPRWVLSHLGVCLFDKTGETDQTILHHVAILYKQSNWRNNLSAIDMRLKKENIDNL